ncbi:heavy metal sensor histidine kinase (plasmid) [Rhizobium sp. CC1099]|uniref:heavy metal sensor histidine kinase n=1 Tax=Rhizobium sp. CC1099 TaxID=3039160 RepID=UPI0024B14C36|nr:heavy metal sensor histidine kinase [Rhizobium sp. CC1099]WFU92201.1 heavy metal sensor histidine kinase [Rhizobium sp. CC1099]
MIINNWFKNSLILRMTLSYASVILILTISLGVYFYSSVRVAQEDRLRTVLAARVVYFARLANKMYSLNDLQARPLLVANMLGAERDVLVFRRSSGETVIEVNPDHVELPRLPNDVSEEDQQVRHSETTLADGTVVYWASITTRALEDGKSLLVLAGHPTTAEREMLDAYRDRTVWAIAVSVAIATLLGYGLLTHGLRPIGGMARKAAEIHPGQLELRLDEKSAPIELRSLAAAFNAMLDRLADGYQRLSQFSADLAHEIRTPLGVLIGQTQVTLAKPRSVKEYQYLLESNLEELEQLHRLSENILFLARADHATQAIERKTIDMQLELQKVADYFEGLATERGLAFQVDACGKAMVDPGLWRRAVGNLVVNAVRHGREDSTIYLRGDGDEQGSSVEVENVGPEISVDELGRLFDRFYKVDRSRSTSTETHGLGLAIVQAIMKLHDGSATVDLPAPGVIRFRLHFPHP